MTVNTPEAGLTNVTDVNASGEDELRDFDLSTIQLEEEPEPTAPKPSKAPRGKAKDSKDKAKAAKEKGPLPRYTEGKYVKPVMELYTYAAMAVAMTGDQPCSTAVLKNAEACAKQWDALAKQNHAVRRALEALLEGGMWTGIAIAHLPILVGILGHHGRIPPQLEEMFGRQTEATDGED